ncbi:MAG: hypothetical protein ACRDJN_13035, partial [Chloroflexota bacterium]
MTGPFRTFIGNAAAVAFLQTSLAGGRAAHAYLLTGPPQIGKRTLARAIAAALVCQGPPTGEVVTAAASVQRPEHESVTPCGACRACRMVAKGLHPDVRVVEAEAGKRGVTIEQVRQLEHAAGLRPYEAARKVLVV